MTPLTLAWHADHVYGAIQKPQGGDHAYLYNKGLVVDVAQLLVATVVNFSHVLDRSHAAPGL